MFMFLWKNLHIKGLYNWEKYPTGNLKDICNKFVHDEALNYTLAFSMLIDF